ncbi:hypothetical protein VPH35_134031 [Triticum aestivum]
MVRRMITWIAHAMASCTCSLGFLKASTDGIKEGSSVSGRDVRGSFVSLSSAPSRRCARRNRPTRQSARREGGCGSTVELARCGVEEKWGSGWMDGRRGQRPNGHQQRAGLGHYSSVYPFFQKKKTIVFPFGLRM